MTAFLELDCGIAYKRLAGWLEDELALPRRGSTWLFSEGDAQCFVALEQLDERELGTVALERTQLTVEGAPEALEAFQALFTLRFMSAGG